MKMSDDFPAHQCHSNNSDDLDKDEPRSTPDEHEKDHDLPEEPASNQQPLSRFDFGDIVTGKMSLSSLSSSEKVKLAEAANETEQIFPYKSVFVGKDKREKKLYFQASWMKKHRWLIYSGKLQGGLCKICVLFP
jgi:hypothetical protein